MQFCQPLKEKTQVGVRKISVSKIPEDLKVPVSEWTVSESIKDSQEYPGTTSKQDADEVESPGFMPDPSKHVE